MTLKACVAFVLFFTATGAALRTEFDHSGNEFYITFVPKPFQHTPSKIKVYVTTPEHVPVTFNISDHGRNFSQTATVAPGGVEVFTFNGEDYELRNTNDRTKAIIVSTDGDKRIYVYGAYDQDSTIDSFVALPPHDLGIPSYTYFAVLLRNGTIHDSTIGIVSARDNTVIAITPTVDIYITTQLVRAGEVVDVILQKEETLLVTYMGDLTGTKFTANRPISFFSGDECSTIPRVFGTGCDQLIEQLPPVEAWGLTFATAPLKTRRSFDVFRVFAAESDTGLNISCVTSEGSTGFTGTLALCKAGFADLQINSTDYCWLEATKRVLLLQFSASKYVDEVDSDPFMALVPAVSQYTNSFTLPTVNSSLNDFLHYLNILIPAEHYQPDQILLNGQTLQNLGNQFTAITVDGVTKAYAAQLTVSSGVYTLVHSNPKGRMGTLVYGFTRIGSYGHSGGFRFPAPSAPQGLQWSMSCPLGNVTLTWDPLPADQRVTVYEVNITQLSGSQETQIIRTNKTSLEVALSPSADCAVVVRGFAGHIAGDVSDTLMFSKEICPTESAGGGISSSTSGLVNVGAIAIGIVLAAFVILVLCITLTVTLVVVFICIAMRRRKGGDVVHMIPDTDGGNGEVIAIAETTKQPLAPEPNLELIPQGNDVPEQSQQAYEPLDLTIQSAQLNDKHQDHEPSTMFINMHELCSTKDDTYEPLLLRVLTDIDDAATADGVGAGGDIYEPMEVQTLQLTKDAATMYATVPNQASRTAHAATPSADHGWNLYEEVSTGSSERKFIQPPETVGEIYNLLSAEKCIEIPRASILTEERLGSGAFGEVCRGTWNTSYGPLEVAIKMVKEGSSEEDRAKFLQEGAIMGQFKHPHILRMLGAVTVDHPNVLVLEMPHKGDLRKHLRAVKQSTTEGAPIDSSLPHQLLTFCREVADGMCYLAHKGYIHRDLAARNVLLDKRLKCKIADFGMSRSLDDDSIYYMAENTKFPIRWTAPEAIIDNKFSSSSDVWSFGILMYEIWSLGGKPFPNLKNLDVLCHIKQGKPGIQPLPPNCPNAIYQIMMQCWEHNHHLRPTFDSLVSTFAVPDRQLLLDLDREEPLLCV